MTVIMMFVNHEQMVQILFSPSLPELELVSDFQIFSKLKVI